MATRKQNEDNIDVKNEEELKAKKEAEEKAKAEEAEKKQKEKEEAERKAKEEADRITAENEAKAKKEEEERVLKICDDKMKYEAEYIQCDAELIRKCIELVDAGRLEAKKKYLEAIQEYNKEMKENKDAVVKAMSSIDKGKYRMKVGHPNRAVLSVAKAIVSRMRRTLKAFKLEDKGGFSEIKIR